MPRDKSSASAAAVMIPRPCHAAELLMDATDAVKQGQATFSDWNCRRDSSYDRGDRSLTGQGSRV